MYAESGFLGLFSALSVFIWFSGMLILNELPSPPLVSSVFSLFMGDSPLLMTVTKLLLRFWRFDWRFVELPVESEGFKRDVVDWDWPNKAFFFCCSANYCY